MPHLTGLKGKLSFSFYLIPSFVPYVWALENV
jgi:hypothetical protein